ncbi:MAG: GntR family transcriptional regulator [Clostridia bacterium]|nr:GntR family transcriptional regulator [Clostridia bacterium]
MQEGRKSVCTNIADRMRRDIELGIVADGEKLPSCRELALKLGVNPNTVQKAYSILEKEGFIEVIPQKGAYARKSPLNSADDIEKLALDQLAALKQAGLTLDQLKKAAHKIYGENTDD